MMKTLLALFAALLLGGAGVFAPCCFTEETPCLSIVIENRCDADIYGYSYDSRVAGRDSGGGGMCLADGGCIPAGDTFSIAFPSEALGLSEDGDEMALPELAVSVSVVDAEDAEHPCGDLIRLSPVQATEYRYALTGDYERGFRLVPDP